MMLTARENISEPDNLQHIWQQFRLLDHQVKFRVQKKMTKPLSDLKNCLCTIMVGINFHQLDTSFVFLEKYTGRYYVDPLKFHILNE